MSQVEPQTIEEAKAIIDELREELRKRPRCVTYEQVGDGMELDPRTQRYLLGTKYHRIVVEFESTRLEFQSPVLVSSDAGHVETRIVRRSDGTVRIIPLIVEKSS